MRALDLIPCCRQCALSTVASSGRSSRLFMTIGSQRYSLWLYQGCCSLRTRSGMGVTPGTAYAWVTRSLLRSSVNWATLHRSILKASVMRCSIVSISMSILSAGRLTNLVEISAKRVSNWRRSSREVAKESVAELLFVGMECLRDILDNVIGTYSAHDLRYIGS